MALTKVQKEGIETLINNNSGDRIVTAENDANTLNGEANLTFNGQKLNVVANDGGQDVNFAVRNTNASGFGAYISGGSSSNQYIIRLDDKDQNEKCRVTSDGKLGIGTTGPTGSLHVKSDVTTNAYFETTGGSGAYLQLALGASGAGLGYLGHSNQLCGSPTAGNLALRFEGTALEFAKGSAIKARITNDGLCFGADTAAANALDDYEEGDWTPDLRFDGATTGITYATDDPRVGKYVKIGRQVTLNYSFSLTSKGSANGSAHIYGIPFAVANDLAGVSTQASGVVGFFNNIENSSVVLNTASDSNSGAALVLRHTVGAEDDPDSMNDSHFTDTTDLRGSITYFTNA